MTKPELANKAKKIKSSLDCKIRHVNLKLKSKIIKE